MVLKDNKYKSSKRVSKMNSRKLKHVIEDKKDKDLNKSKRPLYLIPDDDKVKVFEEANGDKYVKYVVENTHYEKVDKSERKRPNKKRNATTPVLSEPTKEYVKKRDLPEEVISVGAKYDSKSKQYGSKKEFVNRVIREEEYEFFQKKQQKEDAKIGKKVIKEYGPLNHSIYAQKVYAADELVNDSYKKVYLKNQTSKRKMNYNPDYCKQKDDPYTRYCTELEQRREKNRIRLQILGDVGKCQEYHCK